MPTKPPSKPSRVSAPHTNNRKKTNARPDGTYWKQFKLFCSDERFHFILGLLLFIVVLYTLLAFISFFFTGAADASILENRWADQSALRKNITNWTGILGAILANTFLDKWFGVSSFIILYAAAVSAFRLMGVHRFSLWRTFFQSAFWLIWSSIAIGFLCKSFYVDSFFRWGGGHGMGISEWLVSYVQKYGTVLVLVTLLLIFLIFSNKDTIPFLKKTGHALLDALKRKPREKAARENGAETVEPNVAVGTEIVPEEWIEEPINDETDSKDVDFQVESASDEETDFVVETGKTDEPATETDKPDENIALEVDTPQDTEEADPHYNLKNLGKYDPTLDLSHYEFPTLDLLKTYPNENAPVIDMNEQNANKNRIITALRNYGIEIESIKATIGPTITLYEIVPRAGVRISKIRSLESDIMMSLAATGIRIIAPIPGKGTIGIEVPNENPQIVSMHSVIASKKFQEESKYQLPVALGRTITNEIFMFDLAKTPHLLVAGATGQGKSVGLNAIITSLLYKKHPAELKLVLVDPKMVEFNIYAALERHYMAMMPDEKDVIITDSTKVIQTLNSLVIEMEERYKLLMEAHCRNIVEYNEKFINRQLNPEKGHRYLPYIVIVIDEFGDFIMVAGKEVEMPISRITQKARAVGMHMILATQRPSSNIITGIIKANVPSRIAFRVDSSLNSRIILDTTGAEQLVGRGDLLYSGGSDVVRVQCAFVDTPEVEEIVHHISKQQAYPSAYTLPEYVPGENDGAPAPGSVDLSKRDPLFTDVARFVVAQQQGSTSVIQRHFQIGYNRAGRITDQLEAAGIVSGNNGSKGRQVLVQDDFTLTQILEGLL